MVKDNGQGITPTFLPHVFERFRQQDASSTRAASGLGLGLSIAKHLVELHGGTIAADSAGDGRGATFTISLPSVPGHAATNGADDSVSVTA
jgi:signal transduction histidine kinase